LSFCKRGDHATLPNSKWGLTSATKSWRMLTTSKCEYDLQGSHAVWNCLEMSGIFKCHFQTSYNVGNLDKVVEMSWNVWNFDTMTCETRNADTVLGYKRTHSGHVWPWSSTSLWLFYTFLGHLSLVIGLLDLSFQCHVCQNTCQCHCGHTFITHC
jgi:hypothetical protein